jgi:predicted nucleotidyltransferase
VVDREVSDLLEIIRITAGALEIPFFVVGAFARDLILHHSHGVSTGRATEDIDLAVEVSDWKDYETLKSDLLLTKDFLDDAQRQRLLFRNSLPVDIILSAESPGLMERSPGHQITRFR